MAKSVFTDAYAVLIGVLVEARTTAGLTQTQLASRLEKPQSFISKVERGERRLDVIEFLAVARAIGADEQLLFSRVVGQLPGRFPI